MNNSFRVKHGLNIQPTVETANAKGDLVVSTSTGKVSYHNGSSASPVVTEAHTASLTNKTIDADLNTLSNIVNANIKAGAAIALNKLDSLTTSRALVSDGSGVISTSAVTSTELGYLSGVISSVQTQINDKVPYSGATTDLDLGSHNLSQAGYHDFVAIANPASPAAGTARFHAATTNGFTRFEQDNEAATNLTLGRDNVFIARNSSGSTINRGQPVYVTGSSGNTPTIGLARANSTSTLPAIGVALDSIANNSFGQVMKLGVITGIDTSSFTPGNTLWVSPTTAGVLVNTRPAYPNLVQRIGTVLVSGVGNGSLLVTTAPFVGGQETGTINNWQSSGTVTATGFVGPLTGNVTGNVSGTAANITGNLPATQVTEDATHRFATDTEKTLWNGTSSNVPSSIVKRDGVGKFTIGTINFDALDASTVPVIGAGKDLESSAVTPTELGYLSGVTSGIQNQINNRATIASLTSHTGSTANPHSTSASQVGAPSLILWASKGNVVVGDDGGSPAIVPVGLDGYVLTADSTQTTGVKWAEAAATGGGGGGSLQWIEDTNAPTPAVESGFQVYKFAHDADQDLWTTIKVPTTYQTGNPITLKTFVYSPATSGTLYLTTTSYLIRPSVDVYTSTGISNIGIYGPATQSGATANKVIPVTFDISNSSGQMAGFTVNPGDLIKVKLSRTDSADTSTEAARVLVYASEVTFS